MLEAPQVVGGKENELDFISQPRRLIDCAPKFDDLFEGVQDLKSMQEEARKISNVRTAMGMTDGGSMMRLACLPADLIAAIYEVNPGFIKDRPGFYRWLARHPYYRVGGFIGY